MAAHIVGAPVHNRSFEMQPASVELESTATRTVGSFTSGLVVANEGATRSAQVSVRRTTPVVQSPALWASLRSIVIASYLNVLLVFIPISWAYHFAQPDSHTLTFVFSFLATIPLARLLSFATEEVSLRTGQVIGGLLNATLGDAVELIVAIIALLKCNLQVVHSSLIGSILSNLLLVLGMSFFAGGTRFSEQGFGSSAAQLNSSLLIVSVIAVLLPSMLDYTVRGGATITDAHVDTDILAVSRGFAIILLFVYGAYLVFQLWSHKELYEYDSSDIIASKKYTPRSPYNEKAGSDAAAATLRFRNSHERLGEETLPSTDAASALNARASLGAGVTSLDTEAGRGDIEDPVEEEVPQLSMLLALVLLAIVTMLVAVTSQWLVDSIDGLTASGSISKEFVGIILLPIVGNVAEHATAVSVSVKDKLSLSMGVAVGSSIQIALFVIPLVVTLGWILGKPLTLMFDTFDSVVLLLSVITVNFVVADGKSHWLKGVLLMSLYVIFAAIFWYYPGSDPLSVLPDLKC